LCLYWNVFVQVMYLTWIYCLYPEWNELDRGQRRDYDSLVKVLNNRYGSAERSELYRAKLQTRIRGKDETLPELAQSIKKLTRLAYPIAHSTLISVLSLEHFIDAIPDGDIRLRLREAIV
jgi:hypothetical protein